MLRIRQTCERINIILSYNMETLSLRSGINSISSSPDKSTIVCGGRDIFKLIDISDELKEKKSLRVGRVNLNFSIQHLAWHPREENWILSAAKNSAIVLWDLGKEGYNKLHDVFKNGHSKVVNRVAWHPRETDEFISAGQDGMLNIWDWRRKDSPVLTMHGIGEGARDVQFSPFKDNIFAATFDSGIVQLWDRRSPKNCFNKFNAHNRSALSINWHHSNADLLLSAGSDSNIKVWNITDTSSAKYKIQAPEPVEKALWMPETSGEICSCSHSHDNNLYTWDLSHSYVPKLSFRGHSQPITDFLWLNGHLYTCSLDGKLIKQTHETASHPRDFISSKGVAFNPQGVLSFISKQAPREKMYNKVSLYKSETYDIQNLNIKYKHDSSPISSLCAHNAKVTSGHHSNLWSSVGDLLKLVEKPEDPWLASLIRESLNDTILYYSDIGDLQTAASLSLALDQKGPVKEYEQQLRKLRQHIAATKLNLSNTNLEIFLRCSCGAELEGDKCTKCRGVSICSVCNQGVRGIFTWCQGCNHGGHLTHLKTWFSENRKCPAGCGHECM
jgi:WD40 repeat protein